MQSAFAALAAVVLSSISSAQLTSIPQFTGGASENFDVPQVFFTACIPTRVFSNQGDLCTPSGNYCHTTPSWGYQCIIYAMGVNMFASIGGPAVLTFDQPASRFGGWFGTNSGVPDATFVFSDVNGNVIQSLTAPIPADCQWHWLGWDAGSSIIKSVSANGFVLGGGYTMMDELQADFGPSTPPPTAYCTAGTSSNGCVPSISANANPSVSLASACNIAVSALEGQKTAIIFYGINQTGFTPHAWATGSNSFLCVKSPIQRTGVLNSGGTTAVCNGSILFDWNAYQSAHPSALGNPFSAGQKVYAQCWYRDPPAPKTTNLSNGLEMTCVP
jgi:hypothetical protein